MGFNMVIKGVLKEELINSLHMKKGYERELRKLPKGSLIKKSINGREYYYIVYRENGNVKFLYKGKNVPPELISKYEKTKYYRKKYRNLLSIVKKQVMFLKGTVRGKEPI